MNIDQEAILFKKFHIIECIKKDTVSCVYLADHIYLNRKIILKTLDTNNLADKTILERFKREGKLLAALDHPHIIKVFDFGNWKNYFYISFEYFPGDNLRVFLKKNRLSNSNKESLIIQLASALKIAHQHRIIHRDLKPENILIDKDLNIKIADFGLAFVSDESSITLPTSIVGTPAYMSPEQIRGEKLSEKSDLFSLGIIIYELYSGYNPFLGKDAGETLNNILTFDLSKIRQDARCFPEKIQTIIDHLLQKDAKNRYNSASRILELFDIEEDIADRIRSYKYNKWLIASTFLIMMLIAIIFIMVLLNKKSQSIMDKDQLKEISTALSGKREERVAEPSVMKKEEQNKIKIKPKENEKNYTENESFQEVGNLYIECQPWAYVYLDDAKVDSTPLTKPIELLPRQYELKLVHPHYPTFSKIIALKSKQDMHIKVDLDTLVGFINCNVYPWGKIYINGQYKGLTPLNEPIRLIPGIHRLRIMNPKYKEYEKEIHVYKKDTLNIKYNFELADNNSL
jgi:serine/threonine protein kinase